MTNAKAIIGTLVVVLAALALAPGAGASGGVAQVPPSTSAAPAHDPDASGTPAIGTPAIVSGAAGLATRTPTELGQRVPDWGESSGTTNGFDWDDAAVGAAMMLGLGVIGFGSLAVLNRRRRVEHGSDSRLASA